MAVAPATLALIAAGMAATGAVSQGVAANKQAKFQSSVLKQQSEREVELSAAEERDFRKRQSAAFAERRAAMGGAGVEGATGSSLLASEDFAAEVELMARRIKAGGQTRATRLDQEASLTRRAGRNARTQGLFRAGSALLSGFSEFNDLKRPQKHKTFDTIPGTGYD